MCTSNTTHTHTLSMQSEELHKTISFVLNDFPRSNTFSNKLKKSREKLFPSVEVRISKRLVRYRHCVQFVFGNVRGIVNFVFSNCYRSIIYFSFIIFQFFKKCLV